MPSRSLAGDMPAFWWCCGGLQPSLEHRVVREDSVLGGSNLGPKDCGRDNVYVDDMKSTGKDLGRRLRG